jgi:hypothetical protein
MKQILIKIQKIMSSKTAMLVLSFLGLFLLSTGVSVLVFSLLVKKTSGPAPGSEISEVRSRINLNLPKTEICPLNGAMFTKSEGDIWVTRRPITAMIENHADSRPASGLSKADVIYEAVAEGGITRFLAVFYCNTAAEEVKIAPVRSARIYFVDFASEYGDKPIFMHVGGANNFSGSGDTAREVRALEYLETLGWRVAKGNDFDTTYDSGFPVFWRNYERLGHPVATEHTMMASLDAAYEEAAKREFTTGWDKNFTSWKFSDGKASSSPVASEISFSFWANKPEYDVTWKYDSQKNEYLRFNGGAEQKDFENKVALSAKNVIIFFAKEKGPVDRNLHMYYTTTGTGKALVFQNGEVIEGTWQKQTRTARIKFLDKNGKEISLVRGQIWIEVVPSGNEIKY